PGGCEARPRGHHGRARQLPAGAVERPGRGHPVAAGAREDQRAGEGRRAVDHSAETVRTMARLRLIALAALAACGHGPKLTPASQPDVELARARRDFHRGDCTHATVSLRRLSLELGPTQPEPAEVHYYLAEGVFPTGDKVQPAHDLRQVADQYPTSD